MGCQCSRMSRSGTPGDRVFASVERTLQNDDKDPGIQCGFGSRYQVGQLLGRGAYARVFVCHNFVARREVPLQGLPLAVKIIREGNRKPKDFKKAVVHEARVWHHLSKKRDDERTQHIVLLFEVYVEKNRQAHFVMERCRATLLTHLRCLEPYDEAALAKILTQMLVTIAYIHSCGVNHRDVKPDNFLVAAQDMIKLCDFGLSAFHVNNRGRAARLPRNLCEYACVGSVGTAPFMSPEVLLGEPHTPALDVWSIGVIAYVLLLGQFPYTPEVHSANDMKLEIREGKREPLFMAGPDPREGACCAAADYDGPSPDAKEFLRSLLTREPSERPTANEALRMDFLRCRSSQAESLPSLQPMLTRACCWGAFENTDESLVNVRQHATSSKSLRGDKSAPTRTLRSQRGSEKSCLSEPLADLGPIGPPTSSASRGVVARTLSSAARSDDHDYQLQLPTLLTMPWSEAMKQAIGDESVSASQWSLDDPNPETVRI